MMLLQHNARLADPPFLGDLQRSCQEVCHEDRTDCQSGVDSCTQPFPRSLQLYVCFDRVRCSCSAFDASGLRPQGRSLPGCNQAVPCGMPPSFCKVFSLPAGNVLHCKSESCPLTQGTNEFQADIFLKTFCCVTPRNAQVKTQKLFFSKKWCSPTARTLGRPSSLSRRASGAGPSTANSHAMDIRSCNLPMPSAKS